MDEPSCSREGDCSSSSNSNGSSMNNISSGCIDTILTMLGALTLLLCMISIKDINIKIFLFLDNKAGVQNKK
ncbi:protein of unknown function [Candidatus Nitrosocaldus cavascurensis]|jgi:hypothetical protein|uniref:Uncharacterized protein n=1 Tax=Candidatus Nitrosocaldus cavascurensis TaxID=2058097 RepID=A0A2K5ASI2_9ARCH|nr:protein of unknown function [Candidatus Nitrosocaldus cavascurensis]